MSWCWDAWTWEFNIFSLHITWLWLFFFLAVYGSSFTQRWKKLFSKSDVLKENLLQEFFQCTVQMGKTSSWQELCHDVKVYMPHSSLFFVFTMLSSISTWPYVTLSFLYMLVTMYSSQSSHVFDDEREHSSTCMELFVYLIIVSASYPAFVCLFYLRQIIHSYFFYGWTNCEYNNTYIYMPYMVISHPTPT